LSSANFDVFLVVARGVEEDEERRRCSELLPVLLYPFHEQ